MNGMVLVVYVSVRERGRERTNNERNTWSIVSEREREGIVSVVVHRMGDDSDEY